MPLITEFLNGGLVTVRHSALLFPGELQRATDCVYRDKNPSIQRAPGRTVYNVTPLSGGLKGLVQLTFDQNTDQLIAWPQGNGTTSNLYKSDFTALTGTFSVITGPGTIANCITINLNATVTAPAGSFLNMLVGVKVSGPGISAGTYILTVNSDTQITLSQAATASATVTLIFDAGIALSMSDTGKELLDIVQWQSTFFVLPRVGTVNRLFWKQFSGTNAPETLIMRPAGLQPISNAPTVSVQAGPAWSATLGIGYYWFLITEILLSDNSNINDVEAGYVANGGQAVVVSITDVSNQFVRITFPIITNDGTNGKNRATNWGVYMSFIGPGKAAYPDPTNMPPAATFKRIAKPSIENTSLDIKFTNTYQDYLLPTVTGAGPDALPQFTNPSGFTTIGGVFAFGTSGSGQSEENALSSFGFLTGAPWNTYTVTGIEVKVVSRSPGLGTQAGYWIWLDQGPGATSSNRNFGASTYWFFYPKIWGGQFEKWGISWTPVQIGTLRVIIQKSYTASNQELDVDYVAVRVYYTGASAADGSINLDGPPYQVVTYRSQIGTTVSDPANFIIPSASTGDIFQGSLVLNDVTNPSTLRYSIAGAPESFPAPYKIVFDSKNKDIITYIRRIGQILLVGMRDSIKRVNYLPTEVDADFGKGIAHEDIVVDHGIVGPLAATLFDLKGSGVVCGYVSYNGFNYTDGVSTRPFNLDIKIEDLVNTDALFTSILRVYPREKWLVFYYCPKNAAGTHTKNTRAIVFSYSADKIKNGTFLPVTGPLSISARSAASAKLGGVPYLLTGHQTNGTVYIEDNGIIQPSTYQVHDENDILASAPIAPSIITRKIYPAGYDQDTQVQRTYILYDALGTYTQIPCTLVSGSADISSNHFFGQMLIGTFVKGVGIPPQTIVESIFSDSVITLSQPVEFTGDVTLVFDDGTISIGVRGSGISEPVTLIDTKYFSTLTGDLLVSDQNWSKQGIELQIEKVFISDDISVDLNQDMRIYNFSYLASDAGTEMNRANS